MIDEKNVYLFSRFGELIRKAGDLADEFRLLRVALMSLEVDVANELARDEEEEEETDDL